MSQNSKQRSFQDLPTALGKWQPTNCLGEGTWSRVYQARPIDLTPTGPADYAIKQLRPELAGDPIAQAVFSRDITIGRSISHPNLIPVLDTGIEQQQPYLVMPLLSGISLQQLLAQSHPLSITQALWFLRQVSQGIAALHQDGWIHADIKPTNVMVAADGHATLIDFGLARKAGSDECASQSPFVGTLIYTAPEMISNAVPIDYQADIYSLGVTAYELLTGQPPFCEMPVADLANAQLQRTPPSPSRRKPGLQREITELLLAMLAKQPSHRPTLPEVISAFIRLEVKTFSESSSWFCLPPEKLPGEQAA